MSTSEDVEKTLQRLAQKTYREPTVNIPGQRWVYVFGYTPKGRVAVLGPYNPGDPQIQQDLTDLTDAKEYHLSTRALAAATKQIKHILYSESQDIDQSLDRAMHRRGVDRERR